MARFERLVVWGVLAAGGCAGAKPVTFASDEPDPTEATTDTDPDTEPTEPTGPVDTSTDTGSLPDHTPSIQLSLSPEVASAGEVEGEGHFHLYVDGVYLAAMWSEEPVELEITADTAPGAKELRAALVTSQHEELVPTADTIVTLTVQ